MPFLGMRRSLHFDPESRRQRKMEINRIEFVRHDPPETYLSLLAGKVQARLEHLDRLRKEILHPQALRRFARASVPAFVVRGFLLPRPAIPARINGSA
jgi:hypothetical protein